LNIFDSDLSLLGSNICFRGFIQDLNLFRSDSSLLENIAFIFRNNHREFETMLIDLNLFVKYLKNPIIG